MAQRTIDGEAQMIAMFNRLGGAMKGQVIGTALRAGAHVILNRVKPLMKYKTGTYRRSASMGDPVIAGEKASIEMGSNAPYARALEMGSGLYGTGPGATKAKYKIEAKNAPMLAFVWKNAPAGAGPPGKDGKHRFPFVMHPGIHAQPAWVPGFEGSVEQASDTVGQALGVAVDAAAGV